MKLSIPNWVIATFGLAAMGHTDPRAVADLIFDQPPEPARMECLGQLICRINGGVFDDLRWPFSYGNLARPVRCKGCGGLVNVVPCVACNPPEDTEGEEEDTFVPPAPPEATDCQPGTPEKVEVMRRRVAGGFSPCHPDDPYTEPTPPPVEIPVVRLGDLGMESTDDEV